MRLAAQFIMTALVALQAVTTAQAWSAGWFAGQNCNIRTVLGVSTGSFTKSCTVIGLSPEPHSFTYNGNGGYMIKACTGSACDGECIWRGPGVAGCTNRLPAQGPFRSYQIYAA
jgi:hypothetical protein